MKTVYQKLLKGTNINVVTENFEREYPGITVEIGGPARYTDPTIWCFKTEVQCDHFFRRIFYALQHHRIQSQKHPQDHWS